MTGGVEPVPRVAAAVLALAVSVAAGLATAALADQIVTPAPAGSIQCTSSADGVSYSVEHCNLTGKSILKILVQDDYNVTLPAASVTPNAPIASINATTLEASVTTEEPLPQATTELEVSYEEASEYDLLSSNYFSEEEPFVLLGDPMVSKIVERERERHEESHDPPNWEEFCREAAEEDDEPIHVADGSFHPRYEEVPGVGVYRLHARARSWAEARKVCEREGAQLAVPNSREEALALTAIHNRCQRLLPTHFNDYQYLGVHDDYKEGGWETVVGYPLEETGYVNWAYNQPDNAHHHGENCLSMNRNSYFNDVPCWTELPFICEHV